MVYKKLLRRLIPARCPGCAIPTENGFCTGCRQDFERVERPCAGCGLGLPVGACPRASGVWRVAGIIAPLRYAEPLQVHVQSLKFAGRRSVGRALGELLVNHIGDALMARAVDALVAVPLHRQRFLARGYNQAIEIARPVSAALGIPLLVAGVARTRATPAQSRLVATQRRNNLRGSFSVSRDVAGLHLVIVDDVITTGATVNALALELSRAGAESVCAWAVARSL